MKKILSIVLCIVLFCTSLCLASSAADISQTKTGKFIDEFKNGGGITASMDSLSLGGIALTSIKACYDGDTIGIQGRLFGFIKLKVIADTQGNATVYVPMPLAKCNLSSFVGAEEVKNIFGSIKETVDLLLTKDIPGYLKFDSTGADSDGNTVETFKIDTKPYIIANYSNCFEAGKDLEAMTAEQLLAELQTNCPEKYADVIKATAESVKITFNSNDEVIDFCTGDSSVFNAYAGLRIATGVKKSVLKPSLAIFDYALIIGMILA